MFLIDNRMINRSLLPLTGGGGLFPIRRANMRWRWLFPLLLIAACTPAERSETGISFTQLAPEASHIQFANHIRENDTLNYFTFPYLYLGGGVAAGDINQDGLPDLYFTGNQVPNKLYLNKGGGVFEDISDKAGVSGDDRWYSGVSMVDINHDGWLDIYLSVSGKWGNTANQLFINNGDGTFSEKASAYGIADESISIQSTFFDYNNDGHLDLFVANYPVVRVSAGNQYYKDKMDQNRPEDSGHLYRNNGDGSFTDVTEAAGLARFGLTLGILACDFNQDGYQDLYLSNDFNVPDYYYQNNGDGTFREISQQAMQHTAMFGMGIDATDFNNDGYLDLFQLDMTPEDYKRSKTNMASMRPASFYEAVEMGFNYQYMQNVLQLNNGIGPAGYPLFSDVSRLTGMSNTDWSWGVIGADFDNDGWKDVFISNGVVRDVNNNDVNAQYQSASFFGGNGERDFRLMPRTPIANYAFQNQGDYSFVNQTKNWGLDQKGFSNGFVTTDLDLDGDLDLVINNLEDVASVYINEAQQSGHHYLRIKFNGPETNPSGLGTKVSIQAGGLKQMQELTLTRGYQSSMDPSLHFGLGEANMVEDIQIQWPDGSRQTLQEVSADQILTVDHQAARPAPPLPSLLHNQTFSAISSRLGIQFSHQEDAYDDYRFEPLLPHKNSQIGPGLTVGDVNQDGLEDFFVGNAAGQQARLFIQNPQGTFDQLNGPWEADQLYEDTGALLFDADGDKDLDLYVVSGGNDPTAAADSYQDRLYIQTPSGFVKAANALPSLQNSGATVIAADYDGDGDEDLFVGGRIIPGQYPLPAASHILRNDGGRDVKLRYTDVTRELAPDLLEAGLVTAALWSDFDTDGRIDLLLTGEWMPIRFFSNTPDGFKEVSQATGLADATGWWYSLQEADIDNDGDMDYLAGNLGLNYKYQASAKKPFELYANDFDENGTTDIVLSYQKYGNLVPLRGRECSSQQVPAIKQRFKTFELFADASLADIYGQHMLDQSLHYEARTFAHHWLENKGGGTFTPHSLPIEAQFSSINAIQVFDYNQDAYPDLLVGGNLYQAEVETPRADAGIGLVLTGKAEGGFDVVSPAHSGLMLSGEIKHIHSIQLAKGEKAFLFARNNLPLAIWAHQAGESTP